MYLGYDDNWIREHIADFPSWRKMFNAYYDKFHFGTYTNFRNHLLMDLGITRKFTPEQNQWLIENYSSLTAKECQELFCNIFGIKRSIQTIRTQAYKLGIKQKPETVKRSYQYEHYHSYPIGSVVVRTNTKGISAAYEKTENGWIRQAHLSIGDIPKGKVVVHLDGDYLNNNKDNLSVISKAENAMMTAHKFWSSDPNITKTGILWCELQEVLNEHRDIPESYSGGLCRAKSENSV